MERLGAKADFFSTFHQLCSKLLSPLERQVLQQALQAYRTSGHVADLVSDTAPLWTVPSKLQLLPFVRQVVSLPDRHYFDSLLGIHQGYVVRGPRSDVSKVSSLSSVRSGNHPMAMRGDVHVVKIGSSSASPRMGFNIRGGSEFGLGIFVSHVDPDSPAERAGLKWGDQILESNGVELETASSQTAEDLLSRTHSHTLVVKRTRKIPEWKVTKERILWYDVATRKVVAAPSGEDTPAKERGSEVSEAKDRKVVLKLTRNADFVGLNIRGGKDFGLGIYISRVDPGGLAERAGVEVGDQLLQVNKQRLDNVSHASVVQLLRSHQQLVLTLRTVGRFPAYKEIFTEFIWSDIGEFEDSSPKSTLTHTAELHPQPRVKARHRTGRVTQRTKARESRVDRSPRDSGIDLNGIDLHHVGLAHPDRDYDDVDLVEDDEDRPELFYSRDQDIIFRGNYAQNWRHLDKEYGPPEDAASSSATFSEPRAGSSATYGARAVSVTGDTDSRSSDEDMDYTTFLERKARQDEQKASRRHPQSLAAHANPQTSRQPGSHADRVIQISPTSIEPALYRASDRREPSLVKTSDTVEDTFITTTTTTDRVEPSLVKAEDRTSESTEPVLVKTVIRVDPTQTDHDIETLYLNRSVDRREEVKNHSAADLVQKDAVRHQVTQDGDIYAVVNKPPRLHKQQQVQASSGHPSASPPLGPLSSTGHFPQVFPKSSRSSSDHSDDDDDDDDDNSNSSASQGRGRGGHHRTHIYHINSSPAVKKKAHPDTEKKHKRRSSRKHAKEDDGRDFVVVTEVMDEVAFQPPSPSLDFGRRSSDASSTSNSDSTVTGVGGGDEGESRKEKGAGGVDLLSEEIRRLEARQSNIGSREIISLGGEAPAKDKTEKNSKPEEDKKGWKWSALKKKLTSSMRIKKNSKQPRVTTTTTNHETISMGSIRKKGIFERSFGSQMMKQQTEEKYNLMMVEERARHILPKDESDAVLRHIKKYQEERELDRLVDVLTLILDRPEKLVLLKDIRGVVLPSHVGRFDSLVARHEQTSDDGGTYSKLHLPLSPVHRSDSRAFKPRPKLITTVLDSDGHFHIQSVDHEERDKQLQMEVVDAFQSHPRNKAFNYNDNNNDNDTSSQQRQNMYTPSSNEWTSAGKRVNGVVQRNRWNNSNDVPKPPPPEWRDDVKVVIVEKAPIPPPPSPPPPEEGFVVYLSKQKKNLGLIVCGGAGDHMDPSVRIEMVMPWGAAADDERIESGMHILSVDDHSVKGLTQSEAIALLKRCFTDVRSVNMKLRLNMP
ncbi:hypothetical protein ACOMHN_067167 [Nucella lapillus]